ncbi:MAG TPA: FtsX-like permease family protein, partial [Myxococcota bacterium]|nr:FtsX-like permease family protein [Myxococcota bacterium]
MDPIAVGRLIVSLALRNLWAHKVKSFIVGMLLAFGTMLVVTGSAMIDSMESAMQKSVTSTVSGELQVYSKDAKDELALLGGLSFGPPDIGEINDFPSVEKQLLTVPGVRAVVPMGIVNPTVFGRNELDTLQERMRNAVRDGDMAGARVIAPQIRQIAADLRAELQNRAAISRDLSGIEQEREVLERVDSDAFWASFETDPVGTLDYLDFKLAPLASAGRILYFRTLGVDIEQFEQSFDRFQIVDGQQIPKGQRGFLISKRTYEEFVKNRVARELDAIRKAVVKEGGSIETTPGLKEKVARNSRQYQRILYQLSPADAAVVEAELRKDLPGVQGDLATLLQEFLKVDDSNLEARYARFYELIAPKIQLYDTPVGSTITLRSFTRRGYIKSVNIKVYGTFQFKGLEESTLSGALNLTDLMTFRDLYGKMTAEQQAELKDIQTAVGVKEISKADAEAALFGGGGSVETTTTASSTSFDEFALASIKGRRDEGETDTRSYTREQLREGIALNAAVLLSDPTKIAETKEAIQKLSDDTKMGLKVLDWTQASGIVGQFVVVVRAVLYTCIFIIFLVALVIINNTMVMATLERTFEIGTMRAIGAQRNFVMALFMLETLLLGLISGAIGAGASVALISYLGSVGIVAPSPEIIILFGGPSLHPTFSAGNLLFGLGVISAVSV